MCVQLDMRKTHVGIVALYCVLYLAPLGQRPIIVPGEMQSVASWCETSSDSAGQVASSTSGFVPRCDLSAVSVRFLGRNAFALRLPSALAAGLTALLLFGFVKRCCGDGTSAVLSSTILLTSALFFGVGTAAATEGVYTFFLTGAMACFFLAQSRQGAPRYYVGGLCGFFWGLAVLTQGGVALLTGIAIILSFALWEWRWRNVFSAILLPVLVIGAVLLLRGDVILGRGDGIYNAAGGENPAVADHVMVLSAPQNDCQFATYCQCAGVDFAFQSFVVNGADAPVVDAVLKWFGGVSRCSDVGFLFDLVELLVSGQFQVERCESRRIACYPSEREALLG